MYWWLSQYHLVSQTRGIWPSNIAEDKGCFPGKELLQLLFHARGSWLELQTEIASDARSDFWRLGTAENLQNRFRKSGVPSTGW